MKAEPTPNYYPHTIAGTQKNNNQPENTSQLELVPKNKFIRFTKNWNRKLHCNIFPCIRRHDDIFFRIGDNFDIDLQINNSSLRIGGTVKLIAKKTFKFKDLNDIMAYLDTGKTAEAEKKMLKEIYPYATENTLFDYLIFQKI